MNRRQRQNEQKPKNNNAMKCMECGSTHGTFRKIKKPNGAKGYLCEFCFDDYRKLNLQ